MPVEPTDGQEPPDVEPRRPARIKRNPSIERPSTSPSDGRPFWALWATIIPTREGVELGEQILPAAEDLIRRSRELPKVGWDDWLKDYLIESADQFLRIRRWILMPSPETYR